MIHWKPASLFLIVGRIHITVVAALGVFTFGWLFTGEYPWFLTMVCALDWYIVNLINRVVDLDEDRAAGIIGTAFVDHHKHDLLIWAVGLMIGSLLVVLFISPALTLLRMAAHLLGALYNWPLLPGRRRLKQLYFWKNNASALGFLITVFGYPLAWIWEKGFPGFPRGISWGTVLFTAGFFFLFEISYEVIYDLRDVKGDRASGIRTYPAVHGERTAVRIIDGLIFSSMGILAVGYGLDIVPWRIFIMASAPILQLAVYKTALRRGINAKDCIRITWMGACLLLVYHVWVIAGLPGAGL